MAVGIQYHHECCNPEACITQNRSCSLDIERNFVRRVKRLGLGGEHDHLTDDHYEHENHEYNGREATAASSVSGALFIKVQLDRETKKIQVFKEARERILSLLFSHTF